ncbi:MULTISPECIES: mechanosensitive ion channel family protein [Shewanella]|uniref:Small-conductance mechanosensitive channel n=1 Tax=Shewanella japonica TaxID=93973 RepID=A0ABM6JQY1_9GAMM|nr:MULTISPECIES: mechanosensitive ion channel domain-containing protein [Shewanella]ARD23941.1 mechanosensitive ion channel protein MscS [Shewanella japonica]KPZ72268.1 Small-conductance mechanosensitive channel [Shewanella sp. P1-14-1]MBQ4889371.1 mechanosensitive ion channel [Shewanella sp. MMG014]
MNETGLDQELAQLQNVYDLLTEFIVQYSFQIVGAVIIFLIGVWVANKVSNVVTNQFEKHNIDVTLGNFVSNLVRITIIVMVAIIALGKLGISVTPMVAAIGAASLGAGLALQGMLANYAAGVTIIVTRPFVIGNTIEIQGVSGVVQKIQLGLTILTNEEGELISIPNKHIVGEILHNSQEYKLVDTKFNIDYQTDPQHVIQLIAQALQTQDNINQSRPPQVGINDFNSIGMEIGVRYWVPTNSYYDDKYQSNLAIINALKNADITIPCPVREIHLQQ